MTNITYTQAIPAANHNPAADQPNMRDNNDNNFQIWAVDHVGFNDSSVNNSGTHKFVTLPVPGADPILGTDLYAKIYTKTFRKTYPETYTAVKPIGFNQINGYLPFVKAMVQFVGRSGPGNIAPDANALLVNVVSPIVQTVAGGTATVTVSFVNPLPFSTYYLFADAVSTSNAIFTKNTANFTVQFNALAIPGKRFNLMVI